MVFVVLTRMAPPIAADNKTIHQSLIKLRSFSLMLLPCFSIFHLFPNHSYFFRFPALPQFPFKRRTLSTIDLASEGKNVFPFLLYNDLYLYTDKHHQHTSLTDSIHRVLRIAEFIQSNHLITLGVAIFILSSTSL